MEPFGLGVHKTTKAPLVRCLHGDLLQLRRRPDDQGVPAKGDDTIPRDLGLGFGMYVLVLRC